MSIRYPLISQNVVNAKQKIPTIINARHLSTTTPIISPDNKVIAPSMVYISGEEMTHYAMNLIVDQWVKPYFDITAWQFFDLSCKSRDQTHDKVLKDAVEAGKKIGAIFKEPTITPSASQVMINLCSLYESLCVYTYLILFFFQTNRHIGQRVWFK